MEEKEFYSVDELAEKLNVNPQVVRRQITEGTLKCHRFGKQIRISQADVDAFLQSTHRP